MEGIRQKFKVSRVLAEFSGDLYMSRADASLKVLYYIWEKNLCEYEQAVIRRVRCDKTFKSCFTTRMKKRSGSDIPAALARHFPDPTTASTEIDCE